MEHQDDGQECREKLAEVDPCHSEGCMQVEPTRDVQPCKKQHFTFSLVNLYGTSEINSIVEGKLLKLNGNYCPVTVSLLPPYTNKLATKVFLLLAFSTLAIDWDSDTRRLLFDEQEAQVVVCSFHKYSVCKLSTRHSTQHDTSIDHSNKQLKLCVAPCLELESTTWGELVGTRTTGLLLLICHQHSWK